MEVKVEYLKFYVETERRNGSSPTQIHQKIIVAWGEDTITLRAVQKWCKAGVDGGGEISFTHRGGAGRPRTSRTKENVDDVKELLAKCPHLSLEEIADLVEISATSVFRIITDDLHMRSVIARWVPHELTETQRERRVELAKNMIKTLNQENIIRRLIIVDEKWVYHRSIGTKDANRKWIPQDSAIGGSGDRPRIARRTIHDAKTMVLVAICFDGKFVADILPHGETVDSSFYINFLKKVHHTLSRRVEPLSWEDWVLQHDNARPHTSRQTAQFLASKNVTCLPQPAYSPDYNLLDRWVFTRLENSRRLRNFHDENEVFAHVTDMLRHLEKDDLTYQFFKLKSDLRDIIQLRGDYL
jgi:histone-lysine N-methyltransferase SETMAR